MAHVTRRDFVGSLGLGAGLGALAATPAEATVAETAQERTVHFSGDGIGLSTAAFASLLHRLATERDVNHAPPVAGERAQGELVREGSRRHEDRPWLTSGGPPRSSRATT